MPSDDVSIEVPGADDAEEVVAVADGLAAANLAARPGARFEPVLLAARRHGALVGVLSGRIAWDRLRIDRLWVDVAARGRGIGGRLLEEAERRARQAGAVGAHLDTFDIQSPGFYQRHGYRVFGTLLEYPPGARHLFFWKPFGVATPPHGSVAGATDEDREDDQDTVASAWGMTVRAFRDAAGRDGVPMARRFSLVDVFAEEPFAGNPVAVVADAEGMGTAEMMRITRWLDLSETTFMLPPTTPDADYRVRIFTLEREMPFAGHPTLGTCRAWLAAGGRPRDPATVVQECGAGLVRIRVAGDSLAFAAPPLLRSGPVDEGRIASIADVLRIRRSAIVDAAWADNGPGWIAVLLETAQAVLDLEPARDYPTRVEIGAVGPHPLGSEAAFEVRAFFSDHHGAIREDPVTGSLNASAAQWLIASGRARAPFVTAQGRCLGRDGRVHITTDEQGAVWVGGNATVLFEGRTTWGP